MAKYTISYDEVKQYVERLPEGAKVGTCGDTRKCIIANAIQAKYPKLEAVYVMPHTGETAPRMTGYGPRGAEYAVTTTDSARLNSLAEDFDNIHRYLMSEATREEVLPLFE